MFDTENPQDSTGRPTRTYHWGCKLEDWYTKSSLFRYFSNKQSQIDVTNTAPLTVEAEAWKI